MWIYEIRPSISICYQFSIGPGRTNDLNQFMAPDEISLLYAGHIFKWKYCYYNGCRITSSWQYGKKYSLLCLILFLLTQLLQIFCNIPLTSAATGYRACPSWDGVQIHALFKQALNHAAPSAAAWADDFVLRGVVYGVHGLDINNNSNIDCNIKLTGF